MRISAVEDVTDHDHPDLHQRFLITDDPSGADNRGLKMIKFEGDVLALLFVAPVRRAVDHASPGEGDGEERS
jgi:hypothetical protein